MREIVVEALYLEQSFGATLSEETLANVETPRDVLRALLAGSPAAGDTLAGMTETHAVSRESVTEVPVPSAAETLNPPARRRA